MLEPLQSEPFRAYALITLWSIVGVSNAIIYLLSIVGLLLRPFWRQPVAFLYPWVRLSAKTPDDIAGTPLSPSRLFFIHTLWFLSSVGLWVGLTLYLVVSALNELFPDRVGLDVFYMHGMRVSAWIGFTVLAMYTGAFALWSSWMWHLSLRRSLLHFRYMNRVENGGGLDDPGHYLGPFRKATGWAFMTLPIYIGYVVVGIIVFPPFQG